MKIIKCIANGVDKNFDFQFPFFDKSDVIIEVNFQPAMKYNLVCISNGENADTKFCGGQVQFFKPPKQGSVITIKRKLPVKRIVDYQPTVPYSAKTHNQDMNYVVEILKDIQDATESLMDVSSGAINQEMIDTISQQIEQIFTTIDELRAKIEQSDECDLSGIYEDLENLTDAINVLNALYNELKTQVENMDASSLPDDMDYVVEFQNPTAENGYIWYRKYSSGWIEQGARSKVTDANGTIITLPVKMADNQYSIQTHITDEKQTAYVFEVQVKQCTTSSFHARQIASYMSSQWTSGYYFVWEVRGMAAS